ncbi:MAG TPA: radical SAM protein [Bacteroidales bacterium]|nr:radical SAM protein [Bacteroidales bacterium]
MSGFLFEQIIFGPIRSRRLGISLGVNLLPLNKKLCSYNCRYCECGLTLPKTDPLVFPDKQLVISALEDKMKALKLKNAMIDSITFAGNGEPTLHSDFGEIIDQTLLLRNKYFPDAKISVLSNATKADKPSVEAALRKVDLNILKLDAGTEEMFQKINLPKSGFTLEGILNNLERFKGEMIIQALFVKGEADGVWFDNTTDQEVEAWIGHIKRLRPRQVMIYPISRETPTNHILYVDAATLNRIAAQVENLGIEARVFN